MPPELRPEEIDMLLANEVISPEMGAQLRAGAAAKEAASMAGPEAAIGAAAKEPVKEEEILSDEFIFPGGGRLDPELQKEIARTITPELNAAIKQVESGGDPNAISNKGAIGTHQVIPAAVRDVMRKSGVDDSRFTDEQLRDFIKKPGVSEQMGKAYYTLMMRRYKDPRLAAAAYNAGPGAVDKYGGVPPFKETQEYIAKLEAAGAFGGAQEAAAAQPQAGEGEVFGKVDDPLMAKSQAAYGSAREMKRLAEEDLEAREQKIALAEMQQKQQADYLQRAKERERRYNLETVQPARERLLNTPSIDPGRWWKKQSTGSQILAAIGLAAGGFGAGMSGGKNAAMELINNAIENDLIAQQQDRKKAQTDYNTAVSGLEQMRSGAKNDLQAIANFYKLSWEKVKAVTESLANQTDNAKARANYGQIIFEAQQKQEEWEQEERQAQLKDPEFVGRQIVNTVEGELNPAYLPEKEREKFVSGVGFLNKSGQRQEFTKRMRAIQELNREINFLLKTRHQYRTQPVIRPDLKAQIKSSMATILNVAKEYRNLGAAFTEQEIELMKEQFGDPTDRKWGTVGLEALGTARDPAAVLLEKQLENLEQGWADLVTSEMAVLTPAQRKNIQAIRAKQIEQTRLQTFKAD